MAAAIPILHSVFERVPYRTLAKSRSIICCILGPFSNAVKYRNIHLSEHRSEIYNITCEDDFKNKVMRNSLPVIVNFHAEWCEPCHSLKPLLEKIASENEGHLHLAEVLVDEHADLLHAFEVTAVPAVLGIHRGIVTDKFIGLVSNKQVMEFVGKLLDKNKEGS
ncbi:hypothetical protein SK128_005392 [Halocaridina rubra]|uniref:Thioredoxin domain-containing protein n=1 Tax=Halocaridina rubra TaxID=373956 RepID=A0AAN8XA09_HALRR